MVLVRTETQRFICSAPAFETVNNAKEYSKARMFLNIAKLLTILLTMHFSNAEAERSFLALKRLKT